MVLKRSKHGLNTGCSLKFGPCIATTRYSASTQTVLTKRQPQNNDSAAWRTTDGWRYDLFADDGEIACDDDVQYSVNKHHRWRLLELLCATIDDIRRLVALTDCTAAQMCRLVVIEKQLMAGRHDCVGYHDSGLSHCHVHPHKRYSTAPDLKGRGTSHEKTRRRRRLHNKHFRGVQRNCQPRRRRDADWDEGEHLEQEEKDKWLEEIQYEISTPQPVTARLQLNYQRDRK